MPNLTRRLVDSAPVGYTWDTQLPGFGLRVLDTGRRSYVVRFRTASGTERLLTIGTTNEFHPDEARERAAAIKRAAKDGRDPKLERTAAREAPRLSDLRDRMLDEHCQQRKPRTREGYEIAWRLHILPTLGDIVVADITETDVLKIRRKLAATPTQANRVLACLSKALSLAERWRWRPSPALDDGTLHQRYRFSRSSKCDSGNGHDHRHGQKESGLTFKSASPPIIKQVTITRPIQAPDTR